MSAPSWRRCSTTCAADDGRDWELPMPNHDLKLAAVQADITSDDVQSESKQDLKQFGDFSLGEIAVAAVSRPGSNYSKAAEIEFRRREVMVHVEALEAQKNCSRSPKGYSRSPKGFSRSPKGCSFASEADWMGHYLSCRSNVHPCSADRLRWAAGGRLQQARSANSRMIANTSSPCLRPADLLKGRDPR